MTQYHIPARQDPCWTDASWRTTRLREIVNLHGVSRADVADRLGASLLTVGFWLSEHEAVIPPTKLRLLLLDLNSQVA